MILIVVFVPPLYFLCRGRWAAFFFNLLPYGIACLCVLSFFGAAIAPFFWFVSAMHSVWQYRREWLDQILNQQSDLIAKKMAAELRSLQPQLIQQPVLSQSGVQTNETASR